MRKLSTKGLVSALLALALIAVIPTGCASPGEPTDAGAVPVSTNATSAPSLSPNGSVESPTRPPSEPTDETATPTETPGEQPRENPTPPAVQTELPEAPTERPQTPTEPPGVPPATRSVKVYYFRPALSENLTDPILAPVQRVVDGSLPVGRAALEQLLLGPTDEERSAGFSTNIPASTLVLGLNIADGLATVDLSSNYEVGGGTASMTGRLAEVVFTITQFPTVNEVQFRLDGKPVTVFSSEGLVLDGPVDRVDYTGLLPGIFVDSPAWNGALTGAVRLQGEAAVFEGAFQAVLLKGDGTELTRPFLVQTDNGTGWGHFDEVLTVPESSGNEVILRVLAMSAQDGREINVFEVRLLR